MGAETGFMTRALKLRMLVMSSSQAVWEHILQDTLLIVWGGGQTGAFRLSPLLSSSCRVFYCSQKMRTSRSKEKFAILGEASYAAIG